MFWIAFSGFAGNGKTSTIKRAAAALASQGKRVIVLDEMVSTVFESWEIKNKKDIFGLEDIVFHASVAQAKIVKQLDDVDLVVLQDRTLIDALCFMLIRGEVDETTAVGLCDCYCDYISAIDVLYLFGPVTDEDLIERVMRKDVRAKTISDFEREQELFYKYFNSLLEFVLGQLPVPPTRVVKLPSPSENPSVTSEIFRDLLNSIRRGNR